MAADSAGGTSSITVPAGTYTYTIGPTSSSDTNDPAHGDLDILNGVNVTIDGAGSGSTVINPNHLDRAFSVQAGGALTMSGLTIENGNAVTRNGSGSYPCSYNYYYYNTYTCGGGIFSEGYLKLASDVTVSNSAADFGGGIGTGYNNSSNTQQPLLVNGATMTANSASYEGGGIFNDDYSAVRITGSKITNNKTTYSGYGYGGGVSDEGSSSFTASNDVISGNSVSTGDGYGGGLELDSCSSYTLNHDEIDGNSAYTGGGIVSFCGELNSDGTTLLNNTATYGGGMSEYSGGALTLTNATFSKNTASSQGGGMYVYYSTPSDMINDTFAYNTASGGAGSGGGIYGTSAVSSQGVGVQNTIIAENTGGDCADSGTKSQFSSTADGGYNLDSDGSCFKGTGATGDKTNTNPLLAQPAYNGGPVYTDAELAGSPAIDAGTDANCPTTDARGEARPQGASCDMGAFETTLGAGQLSLAKTAPSSVKAGTDYTYNINVGNKGPGMSSSTTVFDQLPANSTLVAVNPSQGSCTHTGSPAKVTCNLGTLASGTGASVQIVVSVSKVGTVTNSASVYNDQGSSASGSATTKITGTYNGALLLDSTRLHVRHGRVYVPFTCASPNRCTFRFTIVIHSRVKKTHKIATLLFTSAKTKIKSLGAFKTATESAAVNEAALKLLEKSSTHTLTGRLTTRPRTNQRGIIKVVKLILG